MTAKGRPIISFCLDTPVIHYEFGLYRGEVCSKFKLCYRPISYSSVQGKYFLADNEQEFRSDLNQQEHSPFKFELPEGRHWMNIPSEVVNDERIGFGEMILFGFLPERFEIVKARKDFGEQFHESDSTVKRRMKSLVDAGWVFVSDGKGSKKAAKLDTKELVQTDLLEYVGLLLPKGQRNGKRWRELVQVLAEKHGVEKVLGAARYLILNTCEQFSYTKELPQAIEACIDKGIRAAGAVDIRSFVLVSQCKTSDFQTERLRLLCAMYGQAAFDSGCKRAAIEWLALKSGETYLTLCQCIEYLHGCLQGKSQKAILKRL